MKGIFAKVRSVDGRGWMLLTLTLVLCFGVYISLSAGSMVMYGLLAPVGFVLAAEGVRDGTALKSASFRWALAACAAAFAALTVTGMKGDWEIGLRAVWVMALYSMFVMLPPTKYGRRELRREFMLTGEIFVCLYLPFALLAMASVFTGRTMHIPLLSNPLGIQKAGAYRQRIEIFMHSNGTGQYAVMSILFSLYSVMSRRSRAARAFFMLCMVVNLMVLAHVQSRTGTIALGFSLGMIAFRQVWLCPRLKRAVVRFAAAAAALAVVTLAAAEGVSWIYRADVSLVTGNEVRSVESRTDGEERFDVTGNGRGLIWGSALKYLADHPQNLAFGMGENRMSEISEEYPRLEKFGSLHNSFLEVLVSCGLPTLICIVGWLCTLVGPSVRVWLRAEDGGARGSFMLPVFVAVLLLFSMTESMLFVNPRQINFFFYLFCGHVLRYDALMRRQKEIPNEN